MSDSESSSTSSSSEPDDTAQSSYMSKQTQIQAHKQTQNTQQESSISDDAEFQKNMKQSNTVFNEVKRCGFSNAVVQTGKGYCVQNGIVFTREYTVPTIDKQTQKNENDEIRTQIHEEQIQANENKTQPKTNQNEHEELSSRLWLVFLDSELGPLSVLTYFPHLVREPLEANSAEEVTIIVQVDQLCANGWFWAVIGELVHQNILRYVVDVKERFQLGVVSAPTADQELGWGEGAHAMAVESGGLHTAEIVLNRLELHSLQIKLPKVIKSLRIGHTTKHIHLVVQNTRSVLSTRSRPQS
ncbi:Hypothetical_protein [Hexamita inflata]|uniref:Hypothetical_protein n=1 Tax=Hexamita inflata TaxID=28002 RepID=A0AA86Q505_9EUKA|nr:Hypothetical protein HINF_LOCUS39891 [Hexamita inflata]